MESPTPSRVVSTILLVLVGYGLGVASSWSTQRAANPTSLQVALERLQPKPKGADFGQLVSVWDRLHNDFVNKNVNDQQLLQGALIGMVTGLGDPYSAYLSASDSQKFEDELSGTFEGVGMQVGYKNDQVTIIAPLPNSPAERAGLLAGDVIVSVDGKDVGAMNLDQVIDAIRGEHGTVVKLTIQRGNDPQTKTYSITREKITVDSVTAKVVEHNGRRIAAITITSFDRNTGRELRAKAKAISAQNLDGVLLDLRNNPGGYLDQAVDVSSVFVPSGLIVAEVDRDGQRKSFNALGNAFLDQVRVVVLVNAGSASASEIVAGALQDTDHGTIVGTQTFGKGSVQDYRTLEDGSSLKLTIAKWQTPKGRSIDEQGITPDEIVAATDQNSAADPQRDRALDILSPKR